VRLDGVHQEPLDGGRELGIVLAHGFTGSWRRVTVRAIAARLCRFGGVVSFDFRGHGRSGGRSTLGDREVLDVDAAVRAARELGYRRVATCGWSMGSSVVLRHAALHGGVDAVVAVSGPSRWFVRDTVPMRRVHWVVERRAGRMVARLLLRTRISSVRWDPLPESPLEVVGRIAPTPLLLVHGDQDAYFAVDHARALAERAGEPTELWLVPGFGHAEGGATAELVDRIGTYLTTTTEPDAGRPA
jgi:pimeloyl-ACP methyl ester carboxylesterase